MIGTFIPNLYPDPWYTDLGTIWAVMVSIIVLMVLVAGVVSLTEWILDHIRGPDHEEKEN